jgi:hypothetical protein
MKSSFKVICSICGEEFWTTNENKKYCSDRCTRKYYLLHKDEEKPKTRICVICGEQFNISPPAYQQCTCSEKCSKINKNQKKIDYQRKVRKQQREKYGIRGTRIATEFLYDDEMLSNNPALVESLKIIQEVNKRDGEWSKEKQREANKNWLERNPNYKKEYREKNKEKIAEKQRKYRQRKKTN